MTMAATLAAPVMRCVHRAAVTATPSLASYHVRTARMSGACQDNLRKAVLSPPRSRESYSAYSTRMSQDDALR